MTTPLPSGLPDEELKGARSALLAVGSLVDITMKQIDGWLKAAGRMSTYESVVMCVHADKIRDHSAALAERIVGLDKPSAGRVLLLSGGLRVLDPSTVVESVHAYDEARIDTLDEGDIRDAIEFDTELKDTFGLSSIDDELRAPLHDALHVVHDEMEDGVARVPATVVRALKTFLKGHPRGFSRYYTGIDPWPRPSAEIQAEIDAQMPDALYWLRYELKEAFEQEAALAKRKGGENER